MTKTIWVVMGTTGEYSNHINWLVCAYEGGDAARRHADAAMEKAREFYLKSQADVVDRYDDKALREFMGALDPVVERMDYTGSDYVALPVEMRLP